MDTGDIQPLIENLSSNIDELEVTLSPLLKTALSENTSKLPLLDKAKLYVLVTYAIESVLFSYLRINGVDAKNHLVWTELTRIKQYFSKIKNAENPLEKEKNPFRLDKGAANRFIKHGLAGNDRYDAERVERQAKEKAAAQARLEELRRKLKKNKDSKKRKADNQGDKNKSCSSSQVESEDAKEGGLPHRKKRATAAEMMETAEAARESLESKRANTHIKFDSEDEIEAPAEENSEAARRKKKSSKPPRDASEAFQALLKGPLPKIEQEQQPKKKKKHKKSG